MKRTFVMSAAVLLGIAASAAAVGLLSTSGYLISAAAEHPVNILLLWIPIIGVRFFGISRAVLRYLERLVAHDVTFQLLARIRLQIYQRLMPLAPDWSIHKGSGTFVAAMGEAVDSLQNVFLRVVQPALVAAGTIVLSCCILRLESNGGNGLTGLGVGLMCLAGMLIPAAAHSLGRKPGTFLRDAKSELHTVVLGAIEGMTDYILYNRSGRVIADVDDVDGRVERHRWRLRRWSAIQGGLMSFAQQFALWIILWMAIPLIRVGHVKGVLLAAILLTVLTAFDSIMPLPQAFAHASDSRRALEQIHHLTEGLPVQPTDFATTDTTGTKIASTGTASIGSTQTPAGDLVIRGLNFRYRDGTKALSDIQLTVAPGQRIAIVGASGAGKSTLISILLRLYDYEEGNIELDGKSLKELPVDVVRRNFSVLTDDAYIFQASVADNLRMANDSASDAQLQTVLGITRLSSVIAGLEQGMDSYVGEDGALLSGGERQRLALSRALLREAPIVVLDEPTAGLDSTTEQRVFTNILNEVEGRTLIVITHRLAMLDRMDQIFVMDRGHIVEWGAHYELLLQRGRYRAMWELEQDVLASHSELVHA